MTMEILYAENFAGDISTVDKVFYIWYRSGKSVPIYCSMAIYERHKITRPLRQKFDVL